MFGEKKWTETSGSETHAVARSARNREVGQVRYRGQEEVAGSSSSLSQEVSRRIPTHCLVEAIVGRSELSNDEAFEQSATAILGRCFFGGLDETPRVRYRLFQKAGLVNHQARQTSVDTMPSIVIYANLEMRRKEVKSSVSRKIA